MNTENNDGKRRQELEELEKIIERADHYSKEGVRKIESEYMQWVLKEKPAETDATVDEQIDSKKYAIDFVEKGKQIALLKEGDKEKAEQITSILLDAFDPFHHNIKPCHSRENLEDLAKSVKLSAVVFDTGGDDEELLKYVSEFKENKDGIATIILIDEDYDLEGAISGVDVIIRKPINVDDDKPFDKTNYFIVKNDFRARSRKPEKSYSIRKYMPDLDFESYKDILDVDISYVQKLLSPSFEFGDEEPKADYIGNPEQPGAACGSVYTIKDTRKSREAREAVKNGRNIILCVDDLSELKTRDVKALRSVRGIVFNKISSLSHTVINLKSSGIPMIQCNDLVIKSRVHECKDIKIKRGEVISIDGSTGEVFKGDYKVNPSPILNRVLAKSDEEREAVEYFDSLMRRCDEVLKGRTRVMINADDIQTMKEARALGTGEVGLTRSENILKRDRDKEELYGRYISALLEGDAEEIKRVQSEFEEMQSHDFTEILKYQENRRTQIRFLDAPLHELFDEDFIQEMVGRMPEDRREERKNARGVEIGYWYPQIYASQIKALFNAYLGIQLENSPEGVDIDLKMLVPYVYNPDQIKELHSRIKEIAKEKPYKKHIDFEVGSDMGVMIETVDIQKNDGLSKIMGQGVRHYRIGSNDLFSEISDKDREEHNADYTLDNEGHYVMKHNISLTVKDILQDLADTGVGRDNYEVGISLNPVQIQNLRDLMPAFDYISARDPLSVPLVKLALAQVYLDMYKPKSNGKNEKE